MSFPKPQAPDKHDLAVRGAISALLQCSTMTSHALQRAKLSPVPVDLTPIVIENLVAITRSLAFMMDESLAASGRKREIHFKEVKRDNGNGRDGRPRLVMP